MQHVGDFLQAYDATKNVLPEAMGDRFVMYAVRILQKVVDTLWSFVVVF